MTCRWIFQAEEHRVFRLVPLSALAAAMLLTGCESRPERFAYDSTLKPAPPADTKLPQADIVPREPPKAASRLAPHPVQHLSQPDPPVPELVGLNEQQLAGLLGEPTSQVGSGPGKHWYYRMHKCTLNLSLFPNVDTHVFRLLSYEVTENDRHGYGQRCRSELANWLHERQAQQARND